MAFRLLSRGKAIHSKECVGLRQPEGRLVPILRVYEKLLRFLMLIGAIPFFLLCLNNTVWRLIGHRPIDVPVSILMLICLGAIIWCYQTW
jgi:hypothetical protein